MKRLSPTTVRRYSAQQLANHLERVMDAHWAAGEQPYRVDHAYGRIMIREDDCYLAYASLDAHEDLVEVIDHVWRLIERR